MNATNNEKIKVAISHGDINGISYEVMIKTFANNAITELCTPIVYGSAKVAAYHRKNIGLQNFSFNQILSIDKANSKRPNLVNCVDGNIKVELGQTTEIAGVAAIRSLECALTDIMEGKADVLVTAPINKHSLYSEKFPFKGHTDFLRSYFNVKNVLMFMISEEVKIGVVTAHIPLSSVAEKIDSGLVYDKIKLMNESLKIDFNIRKPKIAVLGLNPHAGDEGILGEEEKYIIKPAIKQAFDEGIMVFGPYSADSFFGAGHYKKFDATLAMYHDQGLIPFKTLSFGKGVNYTAGLPVVRTSPDHGVGYDIVGDNKSDPTSFRNAIFYALDIYKNRKMNKELAEVSLKKNLDSISKGVEDENVDLTNLDENNNDEGLIL